MFRDRRKLKLFFLSLVLLLNFVSCVSSKPEYAFKPQKQLANDPELVTGTLPNGFRYILLENHKPQDRVSMHLDVQSGSVNETDEQQGLAHYLEHMVFNGSENFPPGELVKYFQRIGMQFGGDANAHTGYYETVYDVLLPVGDEKSFSEGLTVMEDYANGALLLEEEVQREKNIILAEKRDRDSASYRMFIDTLKFELPGMRITDRAPIGTEEVIKSTDRTVLKHYYDQWYRPEKMILVAVGDFDTVMAERLIKQRFSGIQPRAPAKEEPEPGSFEHKGTKSFYFFDQETGRTSVTIEVLSRTEHEKETYEIKKKKIIGFLGDEILRNRLEAISAQADSPFTDASAGTGTFLKYISYGVISADCSPEKWEKTLELLEKNLRMAIQYGFTDNELERVKKEYISKLKNDVKAAATKDSTELSRKIISAMNYDRFFMSPQQELDYFEPVIKNATNEDVYTCFKEAWAKDHRLLLVTGNASVQSGNLKPEEKIIAIFNKSQAEPVQKPAIKKKVTFPYLKTPEKGIEVSRKYIEDLDITTIDFENGLRLNLKKTDFASNTLGYNLRFEGGQVEMPVNRPGIITCAASVMNESGLNQLDREDLRRALAGKNTSISFVVGEDNYAYTGQSVSGEIELLFQLLHAYLSDQGFSENAYRTTMQKYEQKYTELESTIEGVMQLNSARFFAGGDNRFGPPHMSELKKLDYETVKTFASAFLKGRKPELSIVGDFNRQEVIDFASQYLATPELFSAHSADIQKRDDMPVFTAHKEKKVTVKTSINKAMIYVGYPTTDYWDITKTRKLSVLGAVFSERLREIVREQDGAAYSPFAYNAPSLAFKGYGVFNVAVSVHPAQLETIEKSIKGIAENLAANGVTDDELHRSLKPVLTSIRDMRKTNTYWLNSVMTGSKSHPERFDWCRSFLKSYSEISKKDMDAYAAEYFVNDNASVIKVMPEMSE